MCVYRNALVTVAVVIVRQLKTVLVVDAEKTVSCLPGKSRWSPWNSGQFAFDETRTLLLAFRCLLTVLITVYQFLLRCSWVVDLLVDPQTAMPAKVRQVSCECLRIVGHISVHERFTRLQYSYAQHCVRLRRVARSDTIPLKNFLLSETLDS